MKLRFLSLLLLVSCQTVSRKPALDLSKVDICDFVFDTTFTLISDENMLSFALTQMNYLNKAYTSEIRAEAGLCSNKAVQNIDLRISQIGMFTKVAHAKEIMLKELESGQLFVDKDFPEKAGCFIECVGTDSEKCEKKCGIRRSEVLGTHQFFKLEGMAQGCYHKEFRREKFQENVAKYLPLYRSYMLRHKAEISEFLDQLFATEARLKKLRAELQSKPSSDGTCSPAVQPEWQNSIENSLVLITETKPSTSEKATHGTDGTGFWIEGKDGEARFLTAYHVHNEKELDLTEGNIKLTYGDRSKRTNKQSKFTIEPGFFDRGMDIAQGRGDFRGPFLKLVEVGAVPGVGQKLYAAGYPRANGRELQILPCRFRGYVKRIAPLALGTAMQFSCEQTSVMLEGMSGGPVIDEVGNVWGVITEGTSPGGLLMASPVFRNADGGVQMGFQGYQVSDLCLNPKDWSSLQRCQLMPNQFEKQIP